MWYDLVQNFDQRMHDIHKHVYGLQNEHCVYKENDNYFIEIEVPRYKNEDLTIELKMDEKVVMLVRGEKDDEKSGFTKKFELTSFMDYDSISSKLEYGVLTITIPTKEEAKPREIQIK